jgi:predicted nucleotide-binding protein (sugar kinase/HSP70/actin superfamily)
MKATFPHFGNSAYAFKSFLEELGAEVIVPPPTTKRTLELGVRHSPEMVCLPFKITLGNFIEALDRGADTLFMAAGARRCRFGFYHRVQEVILRELGYRFQMHALDQYNVYELVFQFLPQTFSVPGHRMLRAIRIILAKSRLIAETEKLLRRARLNDAFRAGRRAQEAFRLIDRAKTLTDIKKADGAVREIFSTDRVVKPRLHIGLVGEIFFMLDSFANQEIEKELAKLGVLVYSERSLYHYLRFLLKTDWQTQRRKRLAKRFLKESPGGEAQKTVAETISYRRNGADGVIHIYPFTCMPENIALEAMAGISREGNFPILSLSFDEQTSRTGLVTRLEAFVDLIERRTARGKTNGG